MQTLRVHVHANTHTHIHAIMCRACLLLLNPACIHKNPHMPTSSPIHTNTCARGVIYMWHRWSCGNDRDCTATVSSDIGFHGKQTQTGTQSYKLRSRISQIEDICKINTCTRVAPHWDARFNLWGRTPVGEFDSYIHHRPKCTLMTSRLTSSKHRDTSHPHRSAGGAAPPQTAHTLTHTHWLTECSLNIL